MSEAKYTAGPWAPGPFHRTVRPDGFERIGVSNGGCVICEVFGKDEKPANARLISAAPDLLEAAEPFVEIAKKALDEDEDYKALSSVSFRVKPDHLKRLVDAYAKATGKGGQHE